MCQENSGDNEITCLIEAARQGDALAESQLCDKVFLELHRIAKHLVPRDQGSVHATLLVHEMWLKLFRRNGLKKTENRRYFFTVAADQMRKILIDHYRKKKTQKAGGDLERQPFEQVIDQAIDDFKAKSEVDFEDLNAALEKLRAESERLYRVVMHRYFAGQTIEQTARLMDMSQSSVERDWRLAQAKLRAQLGMGRD